jgi:acyl-CoA thioesterase
MSESVSMEAVEAYFAGDQFIRHINISLEWVEPGRARARLHLQPHHLNALGIVQGGAIFTVADFAFAVASNSHGTVALGVSATITYMKAARTGTLVADARELSRNPKLGAYAVEVRDDDGDIVATFQGMVYRKKDSIAAAEPTSPQG